MKTIAGASAPSMMRILLDPDPAGTGGTGTGAGAGATGGAGAAGGTGAGSGSTGAPGLQDVLNQYRDTGALAQRIITLDAEARAARADVAARDAQIAELNGRVPKTGQVVLNETAGRQWEVYRSLGSPEEVSQAVTGFRQLARRESIREASKAAGYDPEALEPLLTGGEELSVLEEVPTGSKDPVRIAKVKVGDKTEDLQTYVARKFSKFLPVLKSQSSTNGSPKGEQQGTIKERLDAIKEKGGSGALFPGIRL